MSTARIDISPAVKRVGRRVGHVVAVLVNVVMLVIVQNILEWDILSFLTDEFAEVAPWISLSLIAVIVANTFYLFDEAQVVRATGEIGTNLISIFVTYQILRVFPFDFTVYEFSWGIVARVALILAMVGAGIGMLTSALKLAHVESDKERK
jgi:hypothetical protein